MSTVKSYHPINTFIGKQIKNRNPLPLLLFPPVKECSGMLLNGTTVEPPCATASRKRPPTISDHLLTLTESETPRRRDLHTANMVYKCTHGLAPEYLHLINLMSLSPAPIIFKIVFVIAGRSYGTVCLRLFGKQNPYTFLNLAARNSSNNIHSA